MDGAQRGCESWEIELRKLVFGIVEAPDQEEAPGLEVARMGGVYPVVLCFEDRRCRSEWFRGSGKIARSQRDLGLGDDASRARHSLPRAEGARRAPHQRFRAV
jgi:hypothetical protein